MWKWQYFWEDFQTAVTNDDVKAIKSMCFWNEQFTEEEFDGSVSELLSAALKEFVLDTEAENFPTEAEQPFEIFDFTTNTSIVFTEYRILKYNVVRGDTTNEVKLFFGIKEDGEFCIPMWYIKN